MTLQQLRYAITIADSTSMNEAAKQLFISQPSLSSSIRDLEEELGMELFIRSSRGITLTPEGNEFIGYARQVMEQYRLMEERNGDYLDDERRNLEIQRLHPALYLCRKSIRRTGKKNRHGRIRVCRA